MPDLAEIRARAKAHEAELAARTTWFKVKDLAARWGVSPTTVRSIPHDELPYKAFGRGLKHQNRRYSPEAVAAYEARPPRAVLPKAG